MNFSNFIKQKNNKNISEILTENNINSSHIMTTRIGFMLQRPKRNWRSHIRSCTYRIVSVRVCFLCMLSAHICIYTII